MKKEFVLPILALSLICLVMAGALAMVNSITYPIIAEGAAQRAEAARREVIPHAEGFIPVDIESLSTSVLAAYATTNDAGYVFIVSVRGYGGEMRIIVGVDEDGAIIRSVVLAHSETVGLGTGIFDVASDRENQGGSLLDVDAISGSTITLHAYQEALGGALEAFETIRGA
ncbi:MAG: FMN-binding protein [Oscillospiraceae bacterium]|nr:FMN-binding protein [Oscillospiraceae bacterium]